MNEILFIVPKGYEKIGGMKSPIEHYVKALSEKYTVHLVEMSYHPFRKNFKDLKASTSVEKYHAVLVYGLNQAYATMKYYIQRKKNIGKTVALLMDSESFYAESMLKKTDRKKQGYRYLIKMILKKSIYNLKENYCLRTYEQVLYVSNVDKAYVESRFPNHQADVVVIENGVEIKKAIPVNTHDYKCLQLGFFSTYTPAVVNENLRPIVEQLMPIVLKENPKIKLIVAGRGMEDIIKAYLKQFDYVQYLGSVNAIEEFYKIIDVFIPVTLKPNGILNKILEAWMFGKMVIAYDYNFYSFPEAKKNIHYFAGKDMEEIASVINSIINDNIDIDSIGRNARTLIVNNYSWDTKQREFMEIIG